jgi:hypothetical protein
MKIKAKKFMSGPRECRKIFEKNQRTQIVEFGDERKKFDQTNGKDNLQCSVELVAVFGGRSE